MNKTILMGRLTKDPELRYGQGPDSMAITKYTLAVNRQYKRQGSQEADFINIVAFGKRAEFANKYFKKGQMVSVVGRLQVHSNAGADGVRRWYTDVVVEEQHFAESRSSVTSSHPHQQEQQNFEPQPSPVKDNEQTGFYPISEDLDDDLPF